MGKIKLFFLVFILCGITRLYAQCDIIETITVCDMTVLDGNSDSNPDGIINLYDAYNALPGVTPISTASGTWFDPGFNFALDNTTGDLYTWDLDDSSENITDYQFQLIDTASTCPDGVVLTVNFILGPFSGEAVPTIGTNDVNVEICDLGVDPCGSSTFFDLNQTLLSIPSAHANGVWSYPGTSPNFIEIQSNRFFIADIPYQPGVPLVDEETFELVYTVQGISPCAPNQETRVKVSVIRQVFAGFANKLNICETEFINGDFDNDIDLLDDGYLVNEDIEGIWLNDQDPTGQISGPGDSMINLRTIYDDLYQNNQRFGCETYAFTYFVESRSAVCPDNSSTVRFTFLEYLRPFQQVEAPPEFCVDDESVTTFSLYDLLTFTTENGVVYDYPNDACTNWTLVSGPSSLGLVSNSASLCTTLEDPNYTAQGTIDLSNITNLDAGTYVFEFTVLPEYNCNPNTPEIIHLPPFGCESNTGAVNTCAVETAQVTIIINPINYAGEDTGVLEFCETDFADPTDLISLLGTNGIDDPIYVGPLGIWIDAISGAIITNPFSLPEINNQQTFNFVYSTTTDEGCPDRANLSFTVYEQYESGDDNTIEVCNDEASFNLFDLLGGNPNTVGTWTGPNGFTTTDNNAIFDPATSEAGNYVYTVPDNVLCLGNQAIITVAVVSSPNAGDDRQADVCRSDAQIDLLSILDPAAASGGTFVDSDATGALSGSVVDVSQLAAGSYDFQYEVQGNPSCPIATSIITVMVLELSPPNAPNQTFCVTDAPTIADLEVNGGSNYNWYDSQTSITVLSDDTLLIDGEDYFVSAVDSNGCESSRISITVTVLPITDAECDCIPDGVSDNDDGENDVLDLCNLTEAFPNFEIQIFNRYGTIVYKGNRNTELFNGTSNVGIGIGDRLPSGVYFFVFDPRDNMTKPFQDNFYLSR